MQAFCWLCGASTGRSHTWETISGHSCGRYKEDADKKINEAQRYCSETDPVTVSAEMHRCCGMYKLRQLKQVCTDKGSVPILPKGTAGNPSMLDLCAVSEFCVRGAKFELVSVPAPHVGYPCVLSGAHAGNGRSSMLCCACQHFVSLPTPQGQCSVLLGHAYNMLAQYLPSGIQEFAEVHALQWALGSSCCQPEA